MATTHDDPTSTQTIEAEALPVLNRFDSAFMATAYGAYAHLRDQGRVARVRLGAPKAPDSNPTGREFFGGGPAWFVTHYDDIIDSLLDSRFSVDLARTIQAPAGERPEVPEELRPISRSIISLDPPDHTRIRKLVQPSFTGSPTQIDDFLRAARFLTQLDHSHIVRLREVSACPSGFCFVEPGRLPPYRRIDRSAIRPQAKSGVDAGGGDDLAELDLPARGVTPAGVAAAIAREWPCSGRLAATWSSPPLTSRR